MLEGVGDHRHKRMTVKALLGSSLEVIKTDSRCSSSIPPHEREVGRRQAPRAPLWG